MKITVGNLVISTPDARIKAFKTKESFVKAQIKEFENTGIDEETVRKASEEMYDAVKGKKD